MTDSQQFARAALAFLDRTTLRPAERETFNLVERTLVQIADGALVVGKPPAPPVEEAK